MITTRPFYKQVFLGSFVEAAQDTPKKLLSKYNQHQRRRERFSGTGCQVGCFLFGHAGCRRCFQLIHSFTKIAEPSHFVKNM